MFFIDREVRRVKSGRREGEGEGGGTYIKVTLNIISDSHL